MQDLQQKNIIWEKYPARTFSEKVLNSCLNSVAKYFGLRCQAREIRRSNEEVIFTRIDWKLKIALKNESEHWWFNNHEDYEQPRIA